MRYLKYILLLVGLSTSLISSAQFQDKMVETDRFNHFIDELSFQNDGEHNFSVEINSLSALSHVLNSIDTSSLNPQQRLIFNGFRERYHQVITPSSTFEKLKTTLLPVASSYQYLGGGTSVNESLIGAKLYARYNNNWEMELGYSCLLQSELLSDTSFLALSDAREMNTSGDWYTGGNLHFYIGYSTDKISVSFNNNRVRWGEGYHNRNIFSGNSPRFPKISLNLKPTKWFEFNSFHGFLESTLDAYINDTLNTTTSVEFHNKYIAANLFTFKPYHFWHLSVGNSIVYSENSAKPVYLIPFMFYKSNDHSYNGVRNDTGQNSQMFFSTSFKYSKWGRFYYSLFVDEITLGDAFSKDENTNLLGYKVGTKIYNIFPKVSAVVEYTHNRPMAYTHYIYSTNFETAGYNLGNPMEENANEWFLSFNYITSAKFNGVVEFIRQKKGPELANPDNDNQGHVFLETIEFENTIFKLKGTYRFSNRITGQSTIRISNPKGDLSYLPELYQERGLVFSFGVRYGL